MTLFRFLSFSRPSPTAEAAPTPGWRVTRASAVTAVPSTPAVAGRRRRAPRRPEPTMFHRCLAVHLHHAGPRSALSA